MSHRLDHRRFLVPHGQTIKLEDYDPAYTGGFSRKKAAQEALAEDVSALAEAQALLWASAEYSVVIILQAMDAAGKDSTLKHVMSGVNPQGVEVHSFKAPTEDERLRHFLWRPMRVWPARGRIAIFNRSYYEEVLVVRVHPEFLEGQRLPRRFKAGPTLWRHRYEEINQFEKMHTENNTCIIKFFLNVSKDEQRERFLKRLRDPHKNWKFSKQDLAERAHWNDYQSAFQDMLSATSTPQAPWYIIPADKKWFMRAAVADIVARRIEALQLSYPSVSGKQKRELKECLRQLEKEEKAAK